MRTYPELAALDVQHLIHPLHQRTEQAASTIWVRGRGAIIEDITGSRYVDALAGLWNVNVGHGREELAEAAAEQMGALAYSSCYIGSANVPAIELAHRITQLAGGRMQAVFFTSGGAEANETALKTARFFWKASDRPEKVKIIARHHGYHGLSLQAMSATAVGAAYWTMFEPRVPGFVHIPTCHPYRHQTRVTGETSGQSAAREIEEAILREGAETVAAFIAEPIPSVGGVLYPADDYWPRVREVCSRYDVFIDRCQEVLLTHGDAAPDLVRALESSAVELARALEACLPIDRAASVITARRVLLDIVERSGAHTDATLAFCLSRFVTHGWDAGERVALFRRWMDLARSHVWTPVPDSRVHRALKFIRRAHVSPNLSLERTARVANVSPWHLTRLFHKITGRTYTVHVRMARVDHACRLLTTTTLQTKQIAGAVGYVNDGELRRDFRHIVGQSPKAFRRARADRR